MTPPGDADLGGRLSVAATLRKHETQTGPGQEEIICQKSWAKYGNCESFQTRGGDEKENVDVVGYL